MEKLGPYIAIWTLNSPTGVVRVMSNSNMLPNSSFHWNTCTVFDCNAHLLGTSHQVYQLSSYKEACSICGGLMCSFLGLGQAWQQCGEHSLFFCSFFPVRFKDFCLRLFGEGLWCGFSPCIRAGLFKAGLR